MPGAWTCRIALVTSMLLALAGLVSVGWLAVIQKWIRVLCSTCESAAPPPHRRLVAIRRWS